MSLADALRRRRSIRGLKGPALNREEVEVLIELALLAPAPHHSRPWRFVTISEVRRTELALAMGSAWETDMIADGIAEDTRLSALDRSRIRIEGAPTLLLGCLVGEGLNTYLDERRENAEWMMAAHSFGAALQNLLLAASERGLGAYWMAAPLYTPSEVCRVLGLPSEWRPQAFIALGRPRSDYQPIERPVADLSESLVDR